MAGREATRNDRPVVGTNQAQCCICWRMFASDSICETHKPYARLPGDAEKGRVAERDQCTEPASLSLIPRTRTDGVTVWGVTDDEEIQRRTQQMSAARAARAKKVRARRK